MKCMQVTPLVAALPAVPELTATKSWRAFNLERRQEVLTQPKIANGHWQSLTIRTRAIKPWCKKFPEV